MSVSTSIFTNVCSQIKQIWIIYTHLKLWVAVASRNFKWVKIIFERSALRFNFKVYAVSVKRILTRVIPLYFSEVAISCGHIHSSDPEWREIRIWVCGGEGLLPVLGALSMDCMYYCYYYFILLLFLSCWNGSWCLSSFKAGIANAISSFKWRQ